MFAAKVDDENESAPTDLMQKALSQRLQRRLEEAKKLVNDFEKYEP